MEKLSTNKKLLKFNSILKELKYRPYIDIIIFVAVLSLKFISLNFMIGGFMDMRPALLISVIGSVLMLAGPFMLLPLKPRLILLLLADLGVSFIIFADKLFYRYFSDVLSMPVLTQASNVSSVKSSVFSLIHGADIGLLIDILIAIPLIVLLFKRGSQQKGKFVKRLASGAVSLVIGFSLAYLGTAILLKSQPQIFKSFYDRVYIVQNIGLANFHAIDAYKFVQGRKNADEPATEAEKQEIKQFLLNKKQQEPGAPALFGEGKGKNLIVVQVEALQEFAIGRSINNQEITPNLNKLIKRSIYFDNYYCETAGGGTSDAEFMANNSLLPVKDGAVYIRYAGDDYYSMPKKLKENGYSSIAMHAYKPGFWNRSVMYNSEGFDEFFNKNDLNIDEVIGMGLSDKSFLKQSLAKLKQQQEPYYAFIITLTSHYPFDNDKRYYSKFDVGEFKNTFFGNYLEAIHYTDEALGQFVEELEAEGMLDDAVLALYGDHYAIPKDKKDDLGKFLNVDMNDFNWVNYQKIPMLIHLPGDKYAGYNHTTGGGVDFMPTILNVMGIDTTDVPMLGRDLLNSEDGLVIMRHGYFRNNKYLSLTSDGVAFDVETGEKYLLDNLQKEKELTENSLEYSDKIIENNLVKEMTEFLRSNK